MDDPSSKGPMLDKPDNRIRTSHSGGSQATGTAQALFERLSALAASTLLHDLYVIDDEHWDTQEGP